MAWKLATFEDLMRIYNDVDIFMLETQPNRYEVLKGKDLHWETKEGVFTDWDKLEKRLETLDKVLKIYKHTFWGLLNFECEPEAIETFLVTLKMTGEAV
jgi:hypothetical protein